MDSSGIDTAPPKLPGLEWGPVVPDDLAMLVELAAACHLADGGLSFMIESDNLRSHYFADAPGAAIGVFAPDKRLLACSTVHIDGDLEAHRARIVGQVRPDQRNKGVGTYLMRWSLQQAHSLLAAAPADRVVLQIATESLTEPAARLYRAHGFEHAFEQLVMRRELNLPLPDCALPQDVTITKWQPELAQQFFHAYDASFRERPGFPGYRAAEWIARVLENDFIPDWSLLARADGVPVGFIIGTVDLTADPPGGFVWQIGVIPAQRRLGLASALMVESMRRMRTAGTPWIQLTVNVNNPGAIKAYVRLGFATVGRRARYERIVKR